MTPKFIHLAHTHLQTFVLTEHLRNTQPKRHLIVITSSPTECFWWQLWLHPASCSGWISWIIHKSRLSRTVPQRIMIHSIFGWIQNPSTSDYFSCCSPTWATIMGSWLLYNSPVLTFGPGSTALCRLPPQKPPGILVRQTSALSPSERGLPWNFSIFLPYLPSSFLPITMFLQFLRHVRCLPP